jgi:hypothetical protein
VSDDDDDDVFEVFFFFFFFFLRLALQQKHANNPNATVAQVNVESQ